MSAIDWLKERYPEFEVLPAEDLAEVMDFFLLWSVFEGHLLNRDADADLITERCHEWDRTGFLGSQVYDDALAHFGQRYAPGGAGSLNALFRDRAAGRHLVEREIDGHPLPRADRIAALFIIIFRLRNNLFHGQKIVDGIIDQRGNFIHANNALRTALEHGV